MDVKAGERVGVDGRAAAPAPRSIRLRTDHCRLALLLELDLVPPTIVEGDGLEELARTDLATLARKAEL